MEELLTFITKSLVENPDEVVVTKVQEKEDSEMYNIEVDPADMGRVIGRQGRIAKAIRTVAKSAARAQQPQGHCQHWQIKDRISGQRG